MYTMNLGARLCCFCDLCLVLSDEMMTKLSSVKIYFFRKNLNVIIDFWYACPAGRFNRT